jgi:hypothetical protein
MMLRNSDEVLRRQVDVVDALNTTAPGLPSEVLRQRGEAPVGVPELKP